MYSPIYRDIIHGTVTTAELESNFKLTTGTPYLAFMGELWGVYYEDFEENWLCFNSTVLYLDFPFVNHHCHHMHHPLIVIKKKLKA